MYVYIQGGEEERAGSLVTHRVRPLLPTKPLIACMGGGWEGGGGSEKSLWRILKRMCSKIVFDMECQQVWDAA